MSLTFTCGTASEFNGRADRPYINLAAMASVKENCEYVMNPDRLRDVTRRNAIGGNLKEKMPNLASSNQVGALCFAKAFQVVA